MSYCHINPKVRENDILTVKVKAKDIFEDIAFSSIGYNELLPNPIYAFLPGFSKYNLDKNEYTKEEERISNKYSSKLTQLIEETSPLFTEFENKIQKIETSFISGQFEENANPDWSDRPSHIPDDPNFISYQLIIFLREKVEV